MISDTVDSLTFCTIRLANAGVVLPHRACLRLTVRAILAHGALISCLAMLLWTTPARAQETYLSVGTGGTTGLYYQVGKTICAIAATDRVLAKSRCYVVSTQGSASNIRDVIKGALVLGMAQSDTHESAVTGIGSFDKPQTELRSIASLYAEPLVIMVGKDSGIRTVRDLKGKRINIGPVGSGQHGLGSLVIRYVDAENTTRERASTLGADRHGAALCSGSIDAFIYAIGHPSANIQAPAQDCGARLLPIDAELRRQLTQQYGYFIETTIPANTYANNPQEIPTFGPVATIVTAASQSDQIVYDITKALFQSLSTLRATHPAMKDLKPEQMIRAALKAPLHQGAVRYYREQGWLR